MGPKLFGERRTDATNTIERLERTEGAVALAVLHDARSERGSDAGQPVKLLDSGAIDVDGAGWDDWLVSGPRCGGARARTRLGGGRFAAASRRAAPPATGIDSGIASGDGRVDLSDLRCECAARALVGGWRAHGTPSAHPKSERGDRGHEEQRLSFGRGRHDGTMIRPTDTGATAGPPQ
jgi:hypothetical protein